MSENLAASGIAIKRVYENASRSDGKRVLVDRLWPRGVAKVDAHIDLWAKEAAPSTGLRKWFGHDPERWVEFSKKYEKELAANSDGISDIIDLAIKSKITLIYAAHDEAHNHAIVLQNHLKTKLNRRYD